MVWVCEWKANFARVVCRCTDDADEKKKPNVVVGSDWQPARNRGARVTTRTGIDKSPPLKIFKESEDVQPQARSAAAMPSQRPAKVPFSFPACYTTVCLVRGSLCLMAQYCDLYLQCWMCCDCCCGADRGVAAEVLSTARQGWSPRKCLQQGATANNSTTSSAATAVG